MSRNVIVDAVSEMCRSRSVSHIIMSSDAHALYSLSLTPQHIRSGIKHATCHSIGIVVVDGMRRDLLLTFNVKRAKPAKDILHHVRSEDWESVLDMIDSLLKSKAKWLHTCEIPEMTDETPPE